MNECILGINESEAAKCPLLIFTRNDSLFNRPNSLSFLQKQESTVALPWRRNPPQQFVIPSKAGIHSISGEKMDSCFLRNDS
jgi:hypothetical protein